MEITIYSTGTCRFCELEKQFLKSRDISFREERVDEDPVALRSLIELSGQLGVPFTVIKAAGREERLLGFDPETLSDLIATPTAEAQ